MKRRRITQVCKRTAGSIIVGLGLLIVSAVTPAPDSIGARAATLDGDQIRKTLIGNSIIHPDFGCVFYRADGTTQTIGQGGLSSSGRWGVLGDLYYSSGQCGKIGCQLIGEYPSFTFRREDGGYEQPVMVVQGNHCEKDGVLS